MAPPGLIVLEERHHHLRGLVVRGQLALEVHHDFVGAEAFGRRHEATDGLVRFLLHGDVAGGGVRMLGQHRDRNLYFTHRIACLLTINVTGMEM